MTRVFDAPPSIESLRFALTASGADLTLGLSDAELERFDSEFGSASPPTTVCSYRWPLSSRCDPPSLSLSTSAQDPCGLNVAK